MNPVILNYAVQTKNFSTRRFAKGQKISKQILVSSILLKNDQGLKWVKSIYGTLLCLIAPNQYVYQLTFIFLIQPLF